MKKPVVDYRAFRLSRLNEPQFSHLKLLAGWLVYFIMYVLTENLIPASSCHVMHCFIDDLIPFNEIFVIFYVSWYLLIVGSLLYFMLYNIESFKNLSKYIIIGEFASSSVLRRILPRVEVGCRIPGHPVAYRREHGPRLLASSCSMRKYLEGKDIGIYEGSIGCVMDTDTPQSYRMIIASGDRDTSVLH